MEKQYNIREVASGLGFTEGPTIMPDGKLMFTDCTACDLKILDIATGHIDSFGYTGGGPNGVAIGPDGAYYVCNNGGERRFAPTAEGLNIVTGEHPLDPIPACIQRVSPDGKVDTLYTECNRNPLCAPNDLVFDAHGGFYFTDFGKVFDRKADLGGLYYAKADGSAIMELIHEGEGYLPLSQPNGCGLSPDGKRIYVSESASARLWSWEIAAPGVLAGRSGFVGNGANFLCAFDDYAVFDSLAVDSAGYIAIGTCVRGVITVVRPDGTRDAVIELPVFDAAPTNLCFGGEHLRKAYVTASFTGRIYEIEWPRPGLRLNYG